MTCVGYLFSGLLFIPFTIGAFTSYNPGVPSSSSLIQLGTIIFVLVIIPLILSFSLWKGYKFGWVLGIVFASFNIVLYLVTFASLSITLSNGPLISSSPIGPLGYAIAYGIVYLGTYIFVIADVLLNIGLIYFLTRKPTKRYFGL
jgi:magnesium-transporting ATPase (P-type)